MIWHEYDAAPCRIRSVQMAGHYFKKFLAPYPSGKGEVCKTFMRRSESARRLSGNSKRKQGINLFVNF